MMPLFSFGGPQKGLRDGKIASWVGDGTYGAAVDIPSIRVLRATLVNKSNKLEGDDRTTDTSSEAQEGKVRLEFGSVSLNVLAIMLGRTLETAGSDPNRTRRIRATAKSMPYFGIAGQAMASQGVGDTHLFIPMAKIAEDFDIVSLENGNYAIPSVTLTCIADENYPVDGEDAVQTATITGTPTGGTFKLTFAGAQTATIAYNAAAGAVQTALQALSTIGSGNALVTGSAGGPYTITFAADLAGTPVPVITADGALLTGGTSPAVAIVETTPGALAELTIFDIIEHETAVAVSIPPLI